MATHLVVNPGSDSIDEMIAAVDRGVYVAAFNYCRILDPKTQVVTGLTRNGTFMIENGAITGAVTNLRFTQSFLNAWGPGKVLAVGDDLRYAACAPGEVPRGQTHGGSPYQAHPEIAVGAAEDAA